MGAEGILALLCGDSRLLWVKLWGATSWMSGMSPACSGIDHEEDVMAVGSDHASASGWYWEFHESFPVLIDHWNDVVDNEFTRKGVS